MQVSTPRSSLSSSTYETLIQRLSQAGTSGQEGSEALMLLEVAEAQDSEVPGNTHL